MKGIDFIGFVTFLLCYLKILIKLYYVITMMIFFTCMVWMFNDKINKRFYNYKNINQWWDLCSPTFFSFELIYNSLCESCVLLKSFSKLGLLLVIWLLQIQNATPSMTSQRYGGSCPFCPFGLVDWGRHWRSLHGLVYIMSQSVF